MNFVSQLWKKIGFFDNLIRVALLGLNSEGASGGLTFQ